MRITINGSVQEIGEHVTLHQLLMQLNLMEERVVIECNGHIISPDHFAFHRAQEGDVIEIVRFVGGG